MFAIWMHFKGEYWILENMCLKIWYMPLKPARWSPQTLIMEKIIMEKIIMEKPVNLP